MSYLSIRGTECKGMLLNSTYQIEPPNCKLLTLSSTNQRIGKDQRWTSSSQIKFQQPSVSQRSSLDAACNLRESLLDSPRRVSGYSSLSHYSTLSSQPGFESTELDLQVTGKLSYPDLPTSPLATTSDGPSLIASASTADGETSLDQTAPCIRNFSASTNFLPDEPFRSPHGFHIPKSKLEKALDSIPGSAASFWQYTLYEGPGVEKEKVKLHYCKSNESSEAVLQMFLNEEAVGFDIEWMAQAKSTDGIKKNVALIQLACEERIALFHIARYPGPETVENLVAPTLKRIMESPDISKVGVAIKGDCTRLKNYLNIHCQGLLELSHLHKLVQYCSGRINKVDRRNVRLAEQVQQHLKLPLHKGDVQTSNWSRDLDYQQTQYAASDSYAGLQLFHVLEAKRNALDPIPPRPAHAELNLPISVGDTGQNSIQSEQREDEENFNDTQSTPSSDLSIEELAREYFHISINDAQVNSKQSNESLLRSVGVQRSQLTSVRPAQDVLTNSKDETPTESFNSPEIEIANQFAANFRPSANRRVAPQALRAYSLWQHQGLSIPEVAARLRKPPIQHSTVITYLCDAICLGNLMYEPMKILEFSSEYTWRPFIQGHRDLLDKARKQTHGL